MGALPAIRRLRRFGALALLAFWSVSPTAGLVRELAEILHDHAADHPAEHADDPGHVHEPALGLAQDPLVIEAPGHGPLICEHHPQGCPKHCVCPKISRPTDGSPEDNLLPEEGPVITRCAEKDPRQAPPVLSLLLLEPAWRMSRPPEASSVHSRGEPRLPAAPCLEPPQKVPLS